MQWYPSERSADARYTAKELSDLTAVNTGSESRVQQHFRDEVDINTIVRRFGVSGSWPVTAQTGVYGDFSGITDFETAVEKIEGVRERFSKLPAHLRERFDNSPAKLIKLANEVSEEQFAAWMAEEAARSAPPVEPVAPVVG